MKKIFVHIGIPKTGSSAIQAFLGLNKKLLNASGFNYPNFNGFSQYGFTDSGNAANLAKEIDNGNRAALDELMYLSPHDKIIISSELLFLKLKENPKKFFEYFSSYNCTYICYVRKFDEYFDSCVNQAIKNHDYQSAEDYIDVFLEEFEWAGVILRALEFIASDKLIIRKYVKGSGIYNGVVDDFLEQVGIKKVIVTRGSPEEKLIVNPSLTPAALAIRTTLNSFEFDRDRSNLKYKVNSILAEFSTKNPVYNMQILSKQVLEKAINYHLPLEKCLSEHLGKSEDLFFYDILSLKEANNPTQSQLQDVVSYLYESNPNLVRAILLSASRRFDIERVREFVNMIYAKAFCDQGVFCQGLLNDDLYDTLCNLAPPVLLISWRSAFDCIHSINNGSVCISKDRATFSLIADTGDAFFSLNSFEANESGISPYLFESVLRSSQDTEFKIYYLVSGCFNYSEEFSLSLHIMKGVNHVRINISDKRFSGFIRVDPGADAGIYEFYFISVKKLCF